MSKGEDALGCLLLIVSATVAVAGWLLLGLAALFVSSAGLMLIFSVLNEPGWRLGYEAAAVVVGYLLYRVVR